MTIVPYFISILLSFPLLADTPIPDAGWIQWVYEFPNKATCEAALEQEEELIYVAVTRQFLSVPHEIKEFQCMTIKEGAQANKALGHKPIWRQVPKPNSPIPKV